MSLTVYHSDLPNFSWVANNLVEFKLPFQRFPNRVFFIRTNMLFHFMKRSNVSLIHQPRRRLKCILWHQLARSSTIRYVRYRRELILIISIRRHLQDFITFKDRGLYYTHRVPSLLLEILLYLLQSGKVFRNQILLVWYICKILQSVLTNLIR